ncbi:MAG TPA: endonuclease/exonuclease/phosphatase family protein [Gaiellaceae bacterium]|nr:endonuclease/exonuclease/phosphatase family protein [Gaiellaceae bacterium]
MLVRTWNLFHGNTVPPGRRRYVEEMVRLMTHDRPDIVCLQEVPPWSLGRIGEWSGMQVFGQVAARPTIGPLPSTVELGRLITDLHPGLLRSGFEGQANVILVSPHRTILSRHVLTLNPFGFRLRAGRRLHLPLVSQLAWAKERRQCIAVRLADAMVVANLHATKARHPRVPDAELVRAARWVDGLAGGAPAVLAGDFNVDTARSVVLDHLDGYTKAGPGVDHVVARGASTGPYDRWTPARRALGELALSDHAPVEVEVG